MSARPAILFMCSELNTGGAERQWALLLPRLSATGLVPHVVTLAGRGRFFDEIRAAGVAAHSANLRSRFDVRGIARTIQLARRTHPRLLVTHEVNAHIVGGFVSRTLRIPHIVVEHAAAGLPIAHHRRLLMRVTAWGADCAIVVSRSQVTSIVGLGFKRRIEVIHNGVPPLAAEKSRAEMRACLGFEPEDFVALLVAGLRTEKRVPFFIDGIAAANRRNACIKGVVAGGGDVLSRLRASTVAAHKPVELLGERSDVADLMHCSDVVCLTSAYEANPVTLLEAMSLAQPVLASDVGGVREIVADGKTGLLFPSEDLECFTSRLNALATNRTLAAAMGEAGRARYDLDFTLERMVDEYAAVFHSMLSAGRSS